MVSLIRPEARQFFVLAAPDPAGQDIALLIGHEHAAFDQSDRFLSLPLYGSQQPGGDPHGQQPELHFEMKPVSEHIRLLLFYALTEGWIIVAPGIDLPGH